MGDDRFSMTDDIKCFSCNELINFRGDILNQVEQIAAKEEEIQDLNPKRRGPPLRYF